ncbi:sulfite exporter TauE/SafE family protein [Sneathiella sp.]|jgi:uncharacterized membrane protein YfcA|uniref:sulfite exporter TauE/SafE family protein n=1 Tax=Sneathiella sp. TaxID=1964365 RepID=UPI0039E28D3C
MIEQIIQDFNSLHFAVICAALLFGGFVKGVSSFGLPTVSIPIIILVLPLPFAISVLAIPMTLSNLVQMTISGDIKGSIRRHWTLLVPLLVTLPVGAYFLAVVNTDILTIMLGIILLIVTSLDLMGKSLTVLKKQQKIVAPIIGISSGIIGGMTSLFGIMPIFFFVSLGLTKERFVSVVSVLLFSGSLVLAISLQRTDILGPIEAFYGLAGMVPILFGIWIGTNLRRRVDPVFFKKVVLVLILLVGLSMIYRSAGHLFF